MSVSDDGGQAFADKILPSNSTKSYRI